VINLSFLGDSVTLEAAGGGASGDALKEVARRAVLRAVRGHARRCSELQEAACRAVLGADTHGDAREDVCRQREGERSHQRKWESLGSTDFLKSPRSEFVENILFREPHKK
jgi:hypothetical protein